MKRTPLILFVSAFALTASACQISDNENAATEAVAGAAIGIDKAAMDTAVKPGDDFYAYANGAWMKAAEIPADRSSVGGFYIADQKREAQVKELLDGLLKADRKSVV